MYQNDGSFAEGYAIGRDSGNYNNNGFGNGWEGLIGLALVASLFGGWGGGFGFGGGRGNGFTGGDLYGWQLGKLATTNDVASGFSTAEIMSDLNSIILGQAQMQNWINQGFAGLNTQLLTGFHGVDNAICTLGYQNQTGFNALSRELAECCCKTQSAIQGVNYNLATNTCALQNTMNMNTRDIVDTVNANYRALHDEIVANRIEDKNAQIQAQQNEINALRLSASQAKQNAYLINELKPCPSPSYIVPNPNCCYNYQVTSGCGCGNF